MRESAEDKIKQVARDAASELLSTAQAAASALNAKTSTDIEWIRSDIKEIKEKLDGKFVPKEDFDMMMKSVATRALDHEDRLRLLERWGFAAIGVLYVASIIIGWVVLMKK